MSFVPVLTTLPASQLSLWPELAATPPTFTLYGGTAIALRLGHRASIDFDFFSNAEFDPESLIRLVPYLRDAEPVQLAPNTLTCRVDRNGPILISFFGGLGLGQVAPSEATTPKVIQVASLLDLSGTKAAVLQKRAEMKDYLDIAAILQQGIQLPSILAAGRVIYRRKVNPLITLKELSYFDDLQALPGDVKLLLSSAAASVDLENLPTLSPYAPPS